MPSNLKRKLAVATTVLAAVAFAGGAYAATQDSPATARQAFLDDAAKRLNVTPAELGVALRGALLDQVSAAVAAGKLTSSQGAAIKQRIAQGGDAPLGAPGWFGPFGGGPGGLPGSRLFGARAGGPLAAAAKFLGLSELELIKELGAGRSLAQVARAHGKSRSGLEAVLVAAAKTGLDRAQRAGFITRTREQQLLAELSARIDAQINRTGRERRGLFGARDGAGPGLPPYPGADPGPYPGADPGPYPGGGNPAPPAGPPPGH